MVEGKFGELKERKKNKTSSCRKTANLLEKHNKTFAVFNAKLIICHQFISNAQLLWLWNFLYQLSVAVIHHVSGRLRPVLYFPGVKKEGKERSINSVFKRPVLMMNCQIYLE